MLQNGKLPNLLPESKRTQCEQSEAHSAEDEQVGPEFGERRPAQNDGTHQFNEVSRGKQGSNAVENPRHGFTRKNKARKENAGHDENHGHLQSLHLVLGACRNEEPKAEQSKNINERGDQQGGETAGD